MRSLLLALAAVALLGLPARAEDICARGAVAGPVPLQYLYTQDLAALRETAYASVDWSMVEQTPYATPEAAAMAQAFADASAALPPALRDLPYLILLAEVEQWPENVVYILTQGPESDMAARLLDAMDRNGLTTEARLYREMIGLYPDWGNSPSDRVLEVLDETGQTRNQALQDSLYDMSFRWPPPGGRALAAADALVASDPATAAAYAARLAAMSEQERFDWLLNRLWSECLDYFDTPEDADRAYLGKGSVQGALLIMSGLLSGVYNGSLQDYFYSASSTMAPQLATLLDRRGMPDMAAALRQAMAAVGTPYPRDIYERQLVLDGFSPADWDRVSAPFAGMDMTRLQAEMLDLARENGLMPPPG